MNIKNLLLLASAALLSLTACSSDDAAQGEAPNSGTPILLAGTLEDAATRAATNIQNNRFEQSTVVDVHIEVTDKRNDKTTYDILQYQVSDASGSLTPVKKVYPYYPVKGTSVNIFGIYPSGYMDAGSFSVQPIQLNKEMYKASDLIFAKVENQSAQQAAVTLPFRHLMSKVIVNLTAGDNGEDITNSKVNLLNVATKIATPDRGELGEVDESSRTTVQMSTDGSKSSAAIIVPQEVPSGVLIEVQLANNDIVNYKTTQTMVFESGKKYTFNIKVVEETLVATYTIDDWTPTTDHEQDIKLKQQNP